MSVTDDCMARILAFIAPRKPVTQAELAAVDAAVAAQVAHEANVSGALGAFGAVDGVTGLSNGEVSVSFSSPRGEGRGLSALARAKLVNAGLLTGYMPVAKRL